MTANRRRPERSGRLPGAIEFALSRSADLFDRAISGPSIDMKLLSRAWAIVVAVRARPGELEASGEFPRWARIECLAFARVLEFCRRCEDERLGIGSRP